MKNIYENLSVLKKLGVVTFDKTSKGAVYGFSPKFIRSMEDWYKLQALNQNNLGIEEIRSGDSLEQRMKRPENFSERLSAAFVRSLRQSLIDIKRKSEGRFQYNGEVTDLIKSIVYLHSGIVEGCSLIVSDTDDFLLDYLKRVYMDDFLFDFLRGV